MAYDINPLITAVDNTLNDLSHDNIQMFVNQHVVPVSTDCAQLINRFINDYNNTFRVDPTAAESIARNFIMQYQDMYINAQVTVGASGAVFGILLAFGMMFPNMRIMLLIPPIPMKAKWFVIIYALIELFGGIHGADYDNVAHWAHLGGMLFGFLLLRYWKVPRYN